MSPRIPSFRRQRLPSTNVGAAPIPVSAAQQGQEAIGRGLQALGGGVINIGQSLFKIEQQKQDMRDDNAATVAGADMSKFFTDSFDTAKRKEYANVNEFKIDRDAFSNDYDAEMERLIASNPMREEAANAFRNTVIANKQSTTRQMESIWWSKEVELGRANGIRAASNKYEELVRLGASLKQLKTSPEIKQIGEGTKSYWKTGQFANEADRALVSVLRNNGRYDDAIKLAETTKAFSPQERESSVKSTESAKERAKDETTSLNNVIQERVMTGFLDGMIASPNDIGPEQIQLAGLSKGNEKILLDAVNFRTQQLKKGIDPWQENNTNLAFTGAIDEALDGSRAEVVKITVPEIMSQIGDITPEQATELINKRTRRLDKNDIINSPAMKDAIGSIENFRREKQKLGTGGLIDFERTEAQILGVKNELRKFADSISGDPDFDSKIAKRKTELLVPLKVEEAQTFWDRFWDRQGQSVGLPERATVNPLRRIPLPHVWFINKLMVEPSSQAEFEERLIQLQITDADKAKNYYDRHSGLWPERYK